MARIGVIGDVHMRTEYAAELRRELEWVVDHLSRRFDPHHLFVLGDLIEHEDSADDDRRNVERVKEVLDNADCSATYLLGNHDVENLAPADLCAVLDQERFTGRVDVDGVRIVYLDSSWGAHGGPAGLLGAEQLRVLREYVAGDTETVVLLHHPVGPFDLTDNYWFEDYPERAFLIDRKELLEVLGSNDSVTATVSGHIHQTDVATAAGTMHISLNAFSKETPGEPITGTYAELTVDEGIEMAVRAREDTLSTFSA